ncbi:hypothetical protein CNX65_02435 [Actinosynnema pretiosum]|uniref:Uncharacterized protein n=1 Tax=Actinosynnema pretiosum TaxID=42197 RepID=A0A290YZW3_9PSEU|nr:hypothetical protein CNX65_02435 [Actinosynnema pretiosum]
MVAPEGLTGVGRAAEGPSGEGGCAGHGGWCAAGLPGGAGWPSGGRGPVPVASGRASARAKGTVGSPHGAWRGTGGAAAGRRALAGVASGRAVPENSVTTDSFGTSAGPL